ncbi:MAG: enoyl-CoA hydratase/isomerase family protein [Candidatus Lokiarchaeota archaeon]|nr:enoyl-CoA hydratase/isomerase family protein [Candidatus Lokiarchaeota archaeon]MBD3199732.1 enoyl-CoA hydratase/isomerase family protein [Candidatus Lokiarchaeota archaeon]
MNLKYWVNCLNFDFKTIKFELREDGIGIISLNRPEKLNAISFQMEEELHEILDYLDTNLNCRVLILRGEGKAFSAGTDLQEGLILNARKVKEGYEKYFHLNNISEPIKRKIYHQWRITDIITKFRKIHQPIIALVHGAAAGGGLGMILASDIRIATENARFINASINIGLTGADMGCSYFLPRLIGMARASEILYTGREVNGKEACEIGLVNQLTSKDELLDEGIKFAFKMINKSPLGLRLTKKAINLSLDTPSLDTILQFENSSIVLTFSSDDVKEASKAFFSKKEPNYPLK